MTSKIRAVRVHRFSGLDQDGKPLAGALRGAWGLAVSPDSQHIYVAAYTDNALSAYRRVAGSAPAFIESEWSMDGLGGAAGSSISPDGYHLYVSGNNADALIGMTLNPLTGELSDNPYPAPVDPYPAPDRNDLLTAPADQICQEFVKFYRNHPVAPAFLDRLLAATCRGDTCTIKSSVDDSSYTCTVKLQTSAGPWQLLALTFD
jgi:hypothetical protein